MNLNKSKYTATFLLFILLILTLITNNFASTIAQENNSESITEVVWTKTYGGSEQEQTNAFVQTREGDFVLAGWSTSFETEDRDLFMVKTNSNGEILWSKFFEGSEMHRVNSVIQTLDGGILVVGSTLVDPIDDRLIGRQDMWLLKLDSTGNKLWNQTYGGSSDDEGMSVTQTPNGDIAIAGLTYSYGDGLSSMWLVITDVNGIIKSNQTYGGSSRDYANFIIQTTDGGFALVGRTDSFGEGRGDMWLVKTDSVGTELWNQTYGGSSSDLAYVILETDSNFIIGGQSLSYGDERGDMILVYTDKNGELLWKQTYGGEGIDRAERLIQTLDGDIVIVGNTQSLEPSRDDLRLIKTNATGYPVWEYRCCDGSWDSAIGVAQITENSFIIAGTIDKFGPDDSAMILMKISIGETDNAEISVSNIFEKYSLILIMIPAIIILFFVTYQKMIKRKNKK